MNKEFERGRQDAIKHLGEIDIVRVKRSELNKISTLLYAFLDANSGDISVSRPMTIPKRRCISNIEDIEYVLGYLKGLT